MFWFQARYCDSSSQIDQDGRGLEIPFGFHIPAWIWAIRKEGESAKDAGRAPCLEKHAE